MSESEIGLKALEKAAKYICTIKCGLCPMVVENIPCPQECNLETLPWQCWFAYFRAQSREESGQA
ncbi:MAG: hypothetical protein M0P70_02405 [Desulfobulbaceae bacterium]|nr:hypothetical protein [Desulfobulbaceae bacterium]